LTKTVKNEKITNSLTKNKTTTKKMTKTKMKLKLDNKKRLKTNTKNWKRKWQNGKTCQKSASLQYGTTAFGHCIHDWWWTVFRQIIKTSSSEGSIFFG